MFMNRTQRLIIALREKFPGKDTEEGINFSHASKAIGVSRATIIKWLRHNDVVIKTTNWEAIAKATKFNRHWLELEEGPQKLTDYKKSIAGINAISEGNFKLCPNIQYIKWSQLGNLLGSAIEEDNKTMTQGRINNLSIAIELESNQFSPYATAGETIIVEPNANTHGMKVLAKIEADYYILIHNKLHNNFSDLAGNQISKETQPTIIGPITQIYGAARKG